jgi:hypothetical protein
MRMHACIHVGQHGKHAPAEIPCRQQEAWGGHGAAAMQHTQQVGRMGCECAAGMQVRIWRGQCTLFLISSSSAALMSVKLPARVHAVPNV